MPRGVRKPPAAIEDQVREIQAKIQSYQAKITELNAKKKALLASKEKREMDDLYHLVKQSGKSPSELISRLSK
jgi:septal ring factor EnvC (AmiA/AmiB activator)